MTDPVVTVDGHWLNFRHHGSRRVLAGLPLDSATLTPNHTLRGSIVELMNRRPELAPREEAQRFTKKLSKHERQVRDRPPAVNAAALVHGLRPPRQRRHSAPSRVGSDYISDVLRVLVDVRRDVQQPSGSQARAEQVQRVRPYDAAMLVLTGATRRGRVFVRAALRPRVREEDADLVETRFWSYV